MGLRFNPQEYVALFSEVRITKEEVVGHFEGFKVQLSSPLELISGILMLPRSLFDMQIRFTLPSFAEHEFYCARRICGLTQISVSHLTKALNADSIGLNETYKLSEPTNNRFIDKKAQLFVTDPKFRAHSQIVESLSNLLSSSNLIINVAVLKTQKKELVVDVQRGPWPLFLLTPWADGPKPNEVAKILMAMSHLARVLSDHQKSNSEKPPRDIT